MSTTTTTTSRLFFLLRPKIFRPHHPTPLSPLQLTPKTIPPFPSLKSRRHYSLSSSSAAVVGSEDTAIVGPAHPWPEWVIFVDRLKSKGYFLKTENEEWDGSNDGDGGVYKDASILKDVCFSFARDRYDIFKSLSTENLKTLVEKGCPNTFRKTVNSGKRLRAYVRLEEGDVCSDCNLQGSCDRAFVSLPDMEATARTIDVVRILLNFAVDPLVGSGDMSAGRELVELSARKLLLELTELSETIREPEPEPELQLPQPVARVTQQQEKLEKSPSFIKYDSSRNVEMKQGDWVCPKCNFTNFSRNKHCLKCKNDGLPILGSSDYRVEMKGGDWVCSECKFMNFARNTQCLKCKAKASKRVESDNVEMKKGDWGCPQCKFMNFAKNIKCLKCKGVRPKDLEVATIAMKKGDWNCPDCHFMNFASNAKCKRCQGPPPRSQ